MSADSAAEGRGYAPVVLLVEDEILIRTVTADALRDTGLAVVEVTDGEEALSLLRGGVQVDLVFSDVRMPGAVDGVALASAIRDGHPNIKVILTSALPLTDAQARVADEFVSKPYANADVAMRIKSLVGNLAPAAINDVA